MPLVYLLPLLLDSSWSDVAIWAEGKSIKGGMGMLLKHYGEYLGIRLKLQSHKHLPKGKMIKLNWTE